jgi:hypothetical protein
MVESTGAPASTCKGTRCMTDEAQSGRGTWPEALRGHKAAVPEGGLSATVLDRVRPGKDLTSVQRVVAKAGVPAASHPASPRTRSNLAVLRSTQARSLSQKRSRVTRCVMTTSPRSSICSRTSHCLIARLRCSGISCKVRSRPPGPD